MRLLDARYEMAGDQAEAVSDGTAHAYYQWSALLRALSSFEAYTEIYRDAPGARHVAELLLLRADVPRSLRACTEEIDQILAQLPGANGRPAQRLAAEMDARLRYTGISEILDEGRRLWIGKHSLHLRIHVLAQLAMSGERDQLIVRHRAPEEIGEPAGQLQLADRVSLTRLRPARIDLDAERWSRRFHSGPRPRAPSPTAGSTQRTRRRSQGTGR